MILYTLHKDFLEGIIPFVKVEELLSGILTGVWYALCLFWKPYNIISFWEYWRERTWKWAGQFCDYLENRAIVKNPRLMSLIYEGTNSFLIVLPVIIIYLSVKVVHVAMLPVFMLYLF